MYQNYQSQPLMEILNDHLFYFSIRYLLTFLHKCLISINQNQIPHLFFLKVFTIKLEPVLMIKILKIKSINYFEHGYYFEIWKFKRNQIQIKQKTFYFFDLLLIDEMYLQQIKYLTDQLILLMDQFIADSFFSL